MQFDKILRPSVLNALCAMGYAGPPDEQTAEQMKHAVQLLEKMANPRWAYRRFTLLDACHIAGTKLALSGQSIKKHLTGCRACLFLALTLGDGVERAIRAEQAADMANAVILDALASTLTEQYADAAQAFLAAEAKEAGEFLTPRFSPGYGDLPIALQADFLRLLDAQRAIGLSVSRSGILLPRKSITAIVGVADHPVHGHLAGCNECALFGSCGGTRACARPSSELE